MKCRRKMFVGLALVLVCVLSFGGTLGAVGMYRSSTLPKAYYFCDSVPSIRPAAFEQEFSLEYTVQYEFGFAMSPSDLSARLLNGFFSEQPDYAVCIFEFVRIQPDGQVLREFFQSLKNFSPQAKIVFYSAWARDAYESDGFFDYVDEFQLVTHEDPLKRFVSNIADLSDQDQPDAEEHRMYVANSFILIDRRFVGNYDPDNFDLATAVSYSSFLQYLICSLTSINPYDYTVPGEISEILNLAGQLRDNNKIHLMLYVSGTYYFDMLKPEAGLVSLTSLGDMAEIDNEMIHACGITYSPLASDFAASITTIRNHGNPADLPVYLLQADDRVTPGSGGLPVITFRTLDPYFQDILDYDEDVLLQSLRAFLGRRT